MSSFLNQSDFSIGDLVYERYDDINEALSLVNEDFSNNQLSEIFFELASNHPGVTSLNLSYDQLDEDSVSVLSTYLPNLPNLVDLNLSGNDEIDDPGLASLTHALSESSTITTLNFSSCDIVDGIILFDNLFASSRIINNISLANNNLGDEGADLIFTALSRNTRSALEDLNLSDNNLTDDSITNSINPYLNRQNPITSLDLSFNEIDNGGLESMAASISGNNTINKLFLRRNLFSDVGVFHLLSSIVQCNNLVELDLSDNNLGALGAEHISNYLKTNSSVNTLLLDDIKPSNKGFENLAKALEVNKKLIYISFKNNDLNNDDITHLAKSLREHQALLEVDLAQNCIGLGGLIKIANALLTNTVLQVLSLRSNEFSLFSQQDLRQLDGKLKFNKTLKDIDFSSNDIAGIAKPLVDTFKWSSLTQLNLSDNKIDVRSLEGLKDLFKTNNSLKMVNLNNNKLGSWAKGSLKRSVELVNKCDIPCQIRGLMCASVFMKSSVEYSLDRTNIAEPELTPFGNHFLRLGSNRKEEDLITLYW